MVFTELVSELKKLTPSALFERTREVKNHERTQTGVVLAHLAEIDTRKLYLEFGYPSLFDYCKHGLGYSGSECSRRIQACRVVQKFPALLDAIARGTISLTVASIMAPVLSPENATELLERAEGLTRRQAEELVVEFLPRPVVTSGVRAASAQLSNTPVRDENDSSQLFDTRKPLAPAPSTEVTVCPDARAARGPARRPSRVEPARPEVYNVRFAASRELKDKLVRLGEVLGHQNPLAHLDTLIDRAVDVALDRHDPKRKAERRRKREERAREQTEHLPEDVPITPEGSDEVTADAAESKPSRRVTAEVREQALERAEYQCEHTGPDGTRCRARTHLEIDHVEPYGRGGTSVPSNLQVLCRSHNLWKAEQDYGAELVRRRIAEARERRPGAVRETVAAYGRVTAWTELREAMACCAH